MSGIVSKASPITNRPGLRTSEARLFLLTRVPEHGKMSANAETLASDGLFSTIGCVAELLVAADLLNRGIGLGISERAGPSLPSAISW